jgi:PKD repeat protein
MKHFFNNYVTAFLLLSLFTLGWTACKKDSPDPEGTPVASFQFEVDADNFRTVRFSNFSQNASSYAWEFGDGNSSTEQNPTHTYEQGGKYQVSLVASNASGQSSLAFTREIEIVDPNSALALLAGQESKTWKLLREGTSMGVGPNAESARIWWSLENNGSRPCVYYHEFTFHRNGDFSFDDKGSFFGEGVIFGGTDNANICFEANAANMTSTSGADVSALLSGTHKFEYNTNTQEVTLNGLGAWMGLPHLTTTEESPNLVESKRFKISIQENQGFDLMTISYAYDGLYWDFTYAHYYDSSLEPAVIEDEIPFGEDLPDFAPEQFFNTFNSESAQDVQYLIPTPFTVQITPGVDNPLDPSGPKVGLYRRGTEQFADLQFRMDFDIQFDNFTSFSIDVYMPTSNEYSQGGLTPSLQIFIADASQTEQFWTSWVQYVVDPSEIVVGEWKTYTFDLESPSEGSSGTPKTRKDLDNIGLVIGGSNHFTDGTFYIRNFRFQ